MVLMANIGVLRNCMGLPMENTTVRMRCGLLIRIFLSQLWTDRKSHLSFVTVLQLIGSRRQGGRHFALATRFESISSKKHSTEGALRDRTMEGSTYYYDYSNYSNFSLDTPCDLESVSNSFLAIFLPFLYILVFIVGFVGNGLVVCVLLKHCHKSNLTDLCLLNLSVSDLLFLLTLPLYAHFAAVSHWVFGDFLCHISGGLHNMGFFSSVLFMVLMTLDRYVLIQHAQQASKYRTMKTGIVLSVSVWVLSLCLSLPAFVFTQEVIIPERITCEPYGDNKQWFEYTIFVTNILGLVFPLSVMVACYSRIIPTLMKIRSAKKHRIVKIIVSIMVMFFLFWAPYNITIFLDFLRLEGVLTDSCELESNLRLSTAVTETIAFSHCCLNPIIYAFAGQRFMKRSQVMLRKMLPGIPFSSSRDLSDSSFRMSSVTSRTLVTTTAM